MSVLGADHLTSEGGGRGDLLLAGNFFSGIVMCKIFFSYPSPSTIFFLPLSLSQQLFSNSLYYLDSLIIVNVEFSNFMHCF
jgi:hypothetical protein